MAVWREAPMSKVSVPKTNASLGDVFAALLVIAGTWHVLKQALWRAEAERPLDRNESGTEWADRAIREIDAVRAADAAPRRARS